MPPHTSTLQVRTVSQNIPFDHPEVSSSVIFPNSPYYHYHKFRPHLYSTKPSISWSTRAIQSSPSEKSPPPMLSQINLRHQHQPDLIYIVNSTDPRPFLHFRLHQPNKRYLPLYTSLIDSGATVCVLSSKLAMKLKVHQQPLDFPKY